jgi:pentose-5-phosphate-3-epimerase
LKIFVAPSILAADFGHLADDLQHVIEAGADWSYDREVGTRPNEPAS